MWEGPRLEGESSDPLGICVPGAQTADLKGEWNPPRTNSREMKAGKSVFINELEGSKSR